MKIQLGKFKLVLGSLLLSQAAGAYNPLTHFGQGFRDMPDRQNLITLGVGGALTLVALGFDQNVVDHYASGNPWEQTSKLGNKYLGTGVPGAALGLTILIYGLAAKDERQVDSGQAQLEALLSTGILTGVMKISIRRQRPGGGDRTSFPSGHTSTVFTTAMMLHEMYGSPWMDALGFGLASYTGWSRIVANRHHVSDVLFGATLGIIVAHGFAQHHKSSQKESTDISWLPYFDSREDFGLMLSKRF